MFTLTTKKPSPLLTICEGNPPYTDDRWVLCISPVFSAHKRPIIQKAFPCQAVFMIDSFVILCYWNLTDSISIKRAQMWLMHARHPPESIAYAHNLTRIDCYTVVTRWLWNCLWPPIMPSHPWQQGSWGQHGAHLGPTGLSWAPCWPRELCYLGLYEPKLANLYRTPQKVFFEFFIKIPQFSFVNIIRGTATISPRPQWDMITKTSNTRAKVMTMSSTLDVLELSRKTYMQLHICI